MARVLLGVTGGIAAYKACELARLLVKGGHEVTPILTPGAESFVRSQTFEALARRDQPRELYPHLVDADLLVIAPLSANTLAKLAHGLADNVLTQLALAFRGPVLVAPAMNARMWEHPATQTNAATLRERGVELIERRFVHRSAGAIERPDQHRPRAASDQMPRGVLAHRRAAERRQRMIDRAAQVGRGVDQSAVEVETDGVERKVAHARGQVPPRCGNRKRLVAWPRR